MDDFLDQILNDLDMLAQKILRHKYIYIYDIMMTNDFNFINNGNDINALISYIKLLFEKSGDSTKIVGSLGDKFFLETDVNLKDLNNSTKNVHKPSKYVSTSEIKNISPSFFQDTKNLDKQYQRYFKNEISEKECNLSDISACIYLLSLISLFLYGIYRYKKNLKKIFKA
jgi:hypothetical protein